MIRFTLKCAGDHRFESWFANTEAFDRQSAAGLIECPICGDTTIAKSLMAPDVRPGRNKASGPAPKQVEKASDAPVSNAPSPEQMLKEKLTELRNHVEKNSDYVGLQFASEARAMHEGEIPHRSIYGEAKAEDARKLVKDGVPVAPLPFIPTRKTN